MNQLRLFCASCGRVIPRKKPESKYCSAACRQRRVTPLDLAFEKTTLALLPTTCEDVETVVSREHPQESLQDPQKEGLRKAQFREAARRAARRLAAQGLLVVCQKGQQVEWSTAKGVMDLRAVKAD